MRLIEQARELRKESMSGLMKHNVVKSVTDLQELLSGKHPLTDLRLGEVRILFLALKRRHVICPPMVVG